jgi:2TM domain
MRDDDLNYAKMRERVERRVRKRAEFLLHLAIYIPVNVLMWVICLFVLGPTQWLLIPMIISFGWTIGLIGHGADTYLQTGGLDKMREREMRHEIALERLRLGLDDDEAISAKRKREPVMRLTDDGELLPTDDVQGLSDEESSDQFNDRQSSTSKASDRR